MYLVLDIGCVECGEETIVVGVFETRDGAESVARSNKLYSRTRGYRNQPDVFELPTTGIVMEGYKNAG